MESISKKSRKTIEENLEALSGRHPLIDRGNKDRCPDGIAGSDRGRTVHVAWERLL
jgi:hypothetical protein